MLQHDTDETQTGTVTETFDYDAAKVDNKLACCRVRTTTSMLEIWMDQDNGVKYYRSL